MGLLISSMSSSVVFADDYELVWQEHFNGDVLNEAVWNYEVNGDGGGNNELQYYYKDAVTVKDGQMRIAARRMDYNGKKFTSGRITTAGKVEFTHGKIEIRSWMPETKDGLWPAMWALGADFGEVGWPRCGEIDFVEMGNSNGIKNGTQDRYFNGACHWGFYKNGGYPNYANAVTAPYSMQDDFHLYTIVWDAEHIAMYYDLDKDPDREPYYQMNLTDMEGDWAVGKYFHKPVFLIFNVAVGGNFVGIWNPDEITALPNVGDARRMRVDWIKIYQKNGEGDTFKSPNGVGEPEESGVEEISAQNTKIFYDGVNKNLAINHSAEAVFVYDMQGNEVCKAEEVSFLNVGSLNVGMYVAVARTFDGTATAKFIVQ